jgi:hypothetical protein
VSHHRNQVSMDLSDTAWAELCAIAAGLKRDEPHRRRAATPGVVARQILEAELEQLAALRAQRVEQRRAGTAKAAKEPPR